jgi:hypothetical protein
VTAKKLVDRKPILCFSRGQPNDTRPSLRHFRHFVGPLDLEALVIPPAAATQRWGARKKPSAIYRRQYHRLRRRQRLDMRRDSYQLAALMSVNAKHDHQTVCARDTA